MVIIIPHADCVFTDWAGWQSPFKIHFKSVFHVRDTIVRNTFIRVEIADVSFEGIVHFQNVSLANVTLLYGEVVSTTDNDYNAAVDFYLTYYADDDANYDVPVDIVQPRERSMWGEEFVLTNATMSDCLYLQALPGTVYPGCPLESINGRARLQAEGKAGPLRTYQAAPYDRSEDADDMDMDPNQWFLAKLLDVDDPWLLEMVEVRTRCHFECVTRTCVMWDPHARGLERLSSSTVERGCGSALRPTRERVWRDDRLVFSFLFL